MKFLAWYYLALPMNLNSSELCIYILGALHLCLELLFLKTLASPNLHESTNARYIRGYKWLEAN